MASNSDRLYSSLLEVERQLENGHPDYLLVDLGTAPWKCLNRKLREGGWNAAELDRMVRRFRSVRLDWMDFVNFLNYAHKWSDADKRMPEMGSIVNKIEAAAGVHPNYLSRVLEEESENETGPIGKVLTFISYDLRDKTDHLMEEIGQALRPVLDLSFKARSPMHEFSLWIEFVESVKESLDRINCNLHSDKPELLNAFKEQLTAHVDFVSHVHKIIGHAVPILIHSENCIIEDFFTRVAVLVIRTAHMCCLHRFAGSLSIMYVDLHHEIDPANPKFVESNLKFLEALNQIRASLTADQVAYLVDSFVTHFLGKEPVDKLDKELGPLVIFLVDKPEETINQDLESYLAEIRETIKEAVALGQRWRLAGLSDPIILAKIWLLKEKIWLLTAEIFIKEQLSSSKVSMFSMEDQVQALIERLKNLRAIFKKLRKERIENLEQSFDNGKQTMALIEEVSSKITNLNQSSRANEIKDYRVWNSLHMLLSKIALFKAKSALMALSNINQTLVAQRKDQIQALLEGMEFLNSFVIDKQVKDLVDEEMIFSQIASVGRRIISLYYSLLLDKEIIEEIIQNRSSDLLDEIEVIKAKVIDICPQIPSTNFPKSDGMGFLDFLTGNVLELLKRDSNSIAAVLKHHIREIQLNLEDLRSLLIRMLQTDIDDLGTRVTKMAYEVEYVVDSIEVGIVAYWQQLSWLYYLVEEIRQIKIQAAKLFQEKNPKTKVHNISSHTSGAGTPNIDKAEVSLRDQEEDIIDRLTRGSSQRDIVSVVGMPGIGKTTIAKMVYNNPNVVYHFHRRAWCLVSQAYGKRDLLLNILRDIQGLTDEIQEMADADLELKLYQCLKKNRYLIVMDDVWNVGAWNDLERSFPDDGNGSRILMTSRLRRVTLEAKPDSEPHHLRALSEDESWKLLEMNIFHGGGCCPQELLEVGKEIAEQCKGLPLAVIAVAGILRKTEKKFDWWKKIVKELSYWVFDETETSCRNILELSYNHLPVHLKACFLYFGAFQAGRDIQVKKLMRLWIAEGFVPRVGQRRLEEIAEDYLTDLIDRSLVIICKRRSIGGVKECRIHDLLRDLCRTKSEEDNFLQLIRRYDEPSTFHDSNYGVDFDDYVLNPEKHENRRLSICLKRKHFVDSRPCGPCTRSLIFFASSDTYARRPYNVSFICQQSKLLTVLDLESINIGISFPTEIELLVQLRYLGISGDIDSVPSSIVSLWKLETFILRGLSSKVVLPNTFWYMTSLRHVHVTNHAVFNSQHEELGNSFQLENLVTFSSPSLPYGEHTEKMLRKLPNLRSFRCVFSKSLDSSRKLPNLRSFRCIFSKSLDACSNMFPRLDFLTKLESLKIIYSGRTCCLGEFNLPLNLKKLTLSNFRLPWCHISTIGRLPNLEVLKLHFRAFEGKIWDMQEEEFRQLKFLQLESLNIVQWNASYDHVPKLQQLVVRNCKDLEEVPYDFADISTLQIIKVQWCAQSVEQSVRNIEEAVEGLQVLISRS